MSPSVTPFLAPPRSRHPTDNEVPSFVSGGYIDRKRALHANINAHLSFPRDLATPSDSTPAAERDALAARLRAVGKAGRKGNKRA